MVVFNYSGGEINTKIVYYGPGLSGKTTNLEYIYSKMPSQIKGKMISMKTRTDRTLFFDFLPLDLGDISGFKLRFLLYTVPGQVYYNATRKLVLKGADAVIFVADSDRDKMEENLESLKNLETNLNEHNLSLDTIPWAIQYNKRDLENAMPVEELDRTLNVLNVPSFEAVATKGTGVYETFQKISSMLYYQVKRKLDQEEQDEQEAQAESPALDGPPQQEKCVNTATELPEERMDLSNVIDEALREVEESPGPVTVEAAGIDTGTPPREPEAWAAPEAENDAGCVEHDNAGTVNEPPGIASSSRQDADRETEEFKFASLKELEINGDVGRVVNLESKIESPAGRAVSGEFVTDPCRQDEMEEEVASADTRTVVVEQAERPVENTGTAKRAETSETVIHVPVVLSPSQIQKNKPLKLVLEIEISDD